MNLHNHLAYHGKDATVRNFTKTGTDQYGDPTFSETETETQVWIDRISQTASAWQGEGGQDVRQDVNIYIDSEIDVYDGEDDSYPTEIDVDGRTYEARFINDYDNGITQVGAKRT